MKHHKHFNDNKKDFNCCVKEYEYMKITPKRNDTLLLGVIYPGVEKYLTDYCNSIKFQDTVNFDILILNDNYRNAFPLNNRRVNIINIYKKLTPAEIRMVGIKYAIENKYEKLIFSDPDDYFSKNRISQSKEKLHDYDFVYNKIVLVDSANNFIENPYFKNMDIKAEYSSYLDILDKNSIGYGNSAVKVDKLKNLYIPKEITAVDWWIFSILLLNGCRGVYIRDAINYYRQYSTNLGIGKKLTKKALLKGIKSKEIHYKNLVTYCKVNNLKEEKKIYNQKLNEINELSRYIQDDKFCKKYIKKVNENYTKIYSGWWSNILSLKEWEKYNE